MDEEWRQLILEARKIGLTIKEVQEFLRNGELTCGKLNTAVSPNITSKLRTN
jgi:DNA-binding transcriptional MerR regulator